MERERLYHRRNIVACILAVLVMLACGGISVDRACEMIDELQLEELKKYSGEADSL